MRRMVRTVGLALALGGLGSGGLGLAGAGGAGRPPPPDAFAVYDAAAGLLRTHYAGRAMGEVGGLLRQQREALAFRCGTARPCPADQGRSAVEAVVMLLADGHTGVLWDLTLASYRRAEAERRRWSGMLTLPFRAGELHVVHVDAGSAAERAGLRPWDVLLSVSGQPASDDYATLAGQLAEAENRGTPFTLRVRRGGEVGEVRTVTVTPILWPTGGQPSLRWEGKTAILSVPSFGKGSGAAFGRLVARATSQGATGLVVDLRWNGGGPVAECLEAALALHPQREGGGVNMVGVGRGGRPVYEWRTSPEGQAALAQAQPGWEGPLALLVSRRTASCGEALAYWGQRAGGRVLGVPTQGVLNTVGDLFDLPGGGVLMLSRARATLDGRVSLPERVQPDLTVSTSSAAIGEGRDPVLEEALRVVGKR